MVAAAGLLGLVGAVGTATHQPAQAAPNSVHAPVRSHGWEEDSLPPQLYLWMEVYGGELVGPSTADGWARQASGGARLNGCWAAVGSTTLIMCPPQGPYPSGAQFYS